MRVGKLDFHGATFGPDLEPWSSLQIQFAEDSVRSAAHRHDDVGGFCVDFGPKEYVAKMIWVGSSLQSI